MKKTTCLFIAFLFAITVQSFAQDNSKELNAFTKKFETAYNAADTKALATFFTKNAVRVNMDGTSITGADVIVAEYANSFANSDLQLTINMGKTSNQTASKASTNGTFQVRGTSKQNNEKIEVNGGYENELVKENGAWKISSMKLTNPK
jgi:ketosteroid isomerase-like protein